MKLWTIEKGSEKPVQRDLREGADLHDGKRYFYDRTRYPADCAPVTPVGVVGVQAWELESEAWEWMLMNAQAGAAFALAEVERITTKTTEAKATEAGEADEK